MLIETPGLLLKGTEDEYVSKLQEYYKLNNIIFPEEGKEVILFVSDVYTLNHILKGTHENGGLKPSINYYRAQRILRMKFLIHETNIRNVYKQKANGNIIFVCNDLKYCVVCSYQKGKDRYKIITAYFKNDLRIFSDQARYQKLH